jgi:hypothetical protein
MPWWDRKVGALQQVYAVLSRDPGVSGSANPASCELFRRNDIVNYLEETTRARTQNCELFRRNDTGTDTKHKECELFRRNDTGTDTKHKE